MLFFPSTGTLFFIFDAFHPFSLTRILNNPPPQPPKNNKKVACSPSFSSIDSRFFFLFLLGQGKKRYTKQESIEEKDGLQATFMLFFGGWGGGLLRILVREKGRKA